MMEDNIMRRLIYLFATLCFVLLAASCETKKSRDINYKIIPGNDLYLPVEGSFADLSKGRPVHFEWAPSLAEDNGYVSYEVLFDRVGGDFSNPVGRIAGQLNGSRPYVSADAKTLSRIARASGVGIYSEGSLIWTVRASKGLKGSVYSQSRTLQVLTMNSMEPLPEKVTIGGVGSEDAVNGIAMTASRGIDKVAGTAGAFEAFTSISGAITVKDELGRNYKLNSDGTMTHVEEAEESALPVSGLQWLKIDYDGMIWSTIGIDKVEYYACAWADDKMSTDREVMAYQGKGVWAIFDYPNRVSDNEVFDGRHRFDMTLADESMLYLGTEANLGTEYTTSYLSVWLYTDETIGNADWDKTFNFLESDCGRTFDCYLHLNSDNPAKTWWHEYQFK